MTRIVELHFTLPEKAPAVRLEAIENRVRTLGGDVLGSTMYELREGETKHGLETKFPEDFEY